MAAVNIKYQLSKGRGLGRVLLLHGLDHSVLVHPTIHGEPILTTQAFYYLNQLDVIAEIRFELGSTPIPSNKIEYLIDNYLYEYSKFNKNSKLTTKVTEFKYWKDNSNDMYFQYDQRDTNALALDVLNDESVLDVSPINPEDNTDFTDWCLVKNYSDSIIEDYVSSMSELIQKKVFIQVMPTEERDGYFGKKRLLECDESLLDYYQAQKLDTLINIRNINIDQNKVTLTSYNKHIFDVHIPVDSIKVETYYSPILLAYYFSGLKEINPLSSFVGFYNVLEYYFEEAPRILDTQAQTEKQQLQCVIKWLKSNNEIKDFIESLDVNTKQLLIQDISTSSSVKINKLNTTPHNVFQVNLANWIYSIRCAIVHSKKSRRGQSTSIFEPYSDEANNIIFVIPIIKWLAVACIDTDSCISNYSL